MFKQVTLENFRTHKSTTIELYPVTLLIGNNNSGKTNFLAGIQHFCNLVKKGNPDNKYRNVTGIDLYPYKYRLAKDDEPMSFEISWNHEHGEINYKIEIYESHKFTSNASCQEKITVKLLNNPTPKEVDSGYNQPTNILELREKIQSDTFLDEKEKALCELFFLYFTNTFNYHFQPAFLKQKNNQDIDEEQHNEFNNSLEIEQRRIPEYLGETGSNFQSFLRHVKEKEQRIFSSFMSN